MIGLWRDILEPGIDLVAQPEVIIVVIALGQQFIQNCLVFCDLAIGKICWLKILIVIASERGQVFRSLVSKEVVLVVLKVVVFFWLLEIKQVFLLVRFVIHIGLVLKQIVILGRGLRVEFIWFERDRIDNLILSEIEFRLKVLLILVYLWELILIIIFGLVKVLEVGTLLVALNWVSEFLVVEVVLGFEVLLLNNGFFFFFFGFVLEVLVDLIWEDLVIMWEVKIIDHYVEIIRPDYIGTIVLV